MRLKVWIPTELLFDEEVTKVKAEAENGWFCILPRHIDFVTVLVPGILSFQRPGHAPEYAAVDRGTLVKCGPDVSVSTRNAVRGPDLNTLRDTIADRFRRVQEKERVSRLLEAKLEAELVRQLVQVERYV